MRTLCTPERVEIQAPGRRQLVAEFNGGMVDSDGGVLLLSELEKKRRIVTRVVDAFTDHRDSAKTEHELEEMLKQRIFGIALGYEDLNDHDTLRDSPLLATAAGRSDVLGSTRQRAADRGHALAGKSTLNRLELSAQSGAATNRYKKFEVDTKVIDRLFLDCFIESHEEAPEEVILDIDATDDPIFGHQEGRYFHGYYDKYCYLPLYIFCGDHLLLARLRPSSHDPAKGVVDELEAIVSRIRECWPKARIIVRGDSGFCRDEIMRWCEERSPLVHYIFGLARNGRLLEGTGNALLAATEGFEKSGKKARAFEGFEYRTVDSWACARRVVARIEIDGRGLNDRYVVTNLGHAQWEDRALYEKLYCARGEMENRIKEQQMGLFADRTSTHHMASNQLRLYFSSIAYVLLSTLRRTALAGTQFARAQCWTMRLKLLKIGAVVRVTTRKIWVSLSSSYPYVADFLEAFRRIREIPATSG